VVAIATVTKNLGCPCAPTRLPRLLGFTAYALHAFRENMLLFDRDIYL